MHITQCKESESFVVFQIPFYSILNSVREKYTFILDRHEIAKFIWNTSFHMKTGDIFKLGVSNKLNGDEDAVVVVV